MTDTNQKHVNHIDRLQIDVENGRKQISDQEYVISSLQTEKAKLNDKVEDNGQTMRNQSNKISQLEVDLNHTHRSLDDAKKNIQRLQVSKEN